MAAASLAPLQYNSHHRRAVHTLVCPPSLNLSQDFEATMQFLWSVRQVSRHFNGRIHVDLRPLKDLTAAGALALVAEFDRWRQLLPDARLRATDLAEWDPVVTRKLKEMGFFDVLGATCNLDLKPGPADDRYIKFLSGALADGEAAKSLRLSIESLGPELADRDALYDGLVEAMANVRQHAYGKTAELKHWWMSASVNVDASKLTVMLLDHGQGIPGTLPRSDIWEQVRGFLATLKLGEGVLKDDARLIEAAFEAERSSSGEDYRGFGLRENIRGYIEAHHASGKLRVLSNRGQYIFEKDGGTESHATRSLPVKLPGTFVEWTIERYASNDIQDN